MLYLLSQPYVFLFLFSSFSPPHTLSLSLSLPSFILFFLPHLRTFQHYTSSSHSLSLFIYLFIFTWFQNIRPQRSLDGSSLSQSSWPSLEPSLIFVPNAAQMGQMASVFYLLSFVFFFFFFFCFYCYDLINFKIVFLSLYFDNLIMLKFRDVWEKDCCVFSVCSVAEQHGEDLCSSTVGNLVI